MKVKVSNSSEPRLVFCQDQDLRGTKCNYDLNHTGSYKDIMQCQIGRESNWEISELKVLVSSTGTNKRSNICEH